MKKTKLEPGDFGAKVTAKQLKESAPETSDYYYPGPNMIHLEQPLVTYGQLFDGVWNKERFDPLKDMAIGPLAVIRIAQLALAGWKFCGASEIYVELERDDEVSTVNVMTGSVSVS